MDRYEVARYIIRECQEHLFKCVYIELYETCLCIFICGMVDESGVKGCRFSIDDERVFIVSSNYTTNITVKNNEDFRVVDALIAYGLPSDDLYYHSRGTFEYHDFLEAVDSIKLFYDIADGIVDMKNTSISTISRKISSNPIGHEPCVMMQIYSNHAQLGTNSWGQHIATVMYHINDGHISLHSTFRELPFPYDSEVDDEYQDVSIFHCILEFGEIRDDLKRRINEYMKYKIDKEAKNIEKF